MNVRKCRASAYPSRDHALHPRERGKKKHGVKTERRTPRFHCTEGVMHEEEVFFFFFL